MNISIIYILIFICTLSGYNLTKKKEPDLLISRINDKLYVYTTYHDFKGTRFPSNSMYFITDSGIVLIDTPWDTTQMQPLIDSLYKRHKKKIIMSISTHFHDDRTAGINFLKEGGIRTYTSKLTRDYCIRRNENIAESVFYNDTTFRFGNDSFSTFYPGHGHAPDNITVWFHEDRILFGGCLVKSISNNDLGNIADANISLWENSIKRVMDKYKDAELVIPGHFEWTKKDPLRHTLKLLRKNNKK